MLRLAAARSVRPAVEQYWARTQWPVLAPRLAPLHKNFADARAPDKTILPGSNSTSAAGVPQAPILNPRPSAVPTTDIPPTAAPRIPPTPSEVGSGAASVTGPINPTVTGSATTTGSSPPPKRPRRRLRRFFYTLLILSALGYAGGVYYSLESDNFHDFFTEYVPFGEDAVAYFEDREFRKRFPQREHAARSWGQSRGENKITIGRSSGLTPRVADVAGEDLGQKGRHLSAVEDNSKPHASAAQQQPAEASSRDKTLAVEKAKESGGASSAKTSSSVSTPTSQSSQARSSSSVAQAETSLESISLVPRTLDGQTEDPVVQRLIKMVNNVVTAVNASPEAAKLSSTVQNLKAELSNVVKDIQSFKAEQATAAEDKIKSAHGDFDSAAQELVRRLEQEMREQESKWREDFEQERERLSESYRQKLAAELEAAKKVAEQQNGNNLIQREIELQQQYMDTVKTKVEQERGGRLSKLDALASSVAELEKLTGEWNDVVDTTMQTQHLQVAVEAVKAKVLESEIPAPFVNELVALKEVSGEDDVVNAAIASINPLAYQRGIPTPAQLIDRFRRVAAEVRKASLLPEDAGVASHAASAVLSRFMFQKRADRGLPEGDDVEATLARTEVLLEEGDLDSAVREMNSLKGWAGVLSKDWVRECRTVLEVRQAVDVMSAQARLKSLLVSP